MKIKIAVSLILLLTTAGLNAQDAPLTTSNHRISFNPGYVMIKEGFNYGLVNKGLDLQVAYRYEKNNAFGVFRYSNNLGFGINYRQGLGLMWSFKPADFYYGFKLLEHPIFKLAWGPYASANYHWQVYPELQSGHMFWRTAIELGSRVMLDFPLDSKTLRLTLGGANAGFSSRPPAQTESYFYSMKLKDFVSFGNQDLTFGLQNLMNHIELELELLNPSKKLQLGYKLDYCETLSDPAYRCLIHSINLNWNLARK